MVLFSSPKRNGEGPQTPRFDGLRPVFCEGRGPKDLQGGRPKDSTSHRGHGGTTTLLGGTSGRLANLAITKPQSPQLASQPSAKLARTQPQPPMQPFMCSSHATGHVHLDGAELAAPCATNPVSGGSPVTSCVALKMGRGIPADTISTTASPMQHCHQDEVPEDEVREKGSKDTPKPSDQSQRHQKKRGGSEDRGRGQRKSPQGPREQQDG